MQQYEYKVLCVDCPRYNTHIPTAEEHLNRLGKEGWRLVSAVLLPYTGPQGAVYQKLSAINYYLERPLQPTTAFRG